MKLQTTAWQTAGPFFSFALLRPEMAFVVDESHPQAIVITGTVYDGDGAIVPDAILETWQADATGTYADAQAQVGFTGFGRAGADEAGRFRLVTIKPGGVRDGAGTEQAPHILIRILARGVVKGLVTRLYFADEETRNEACPILARIAPARRPALIAAVAGERAYEIDVHLQGDRESPFFDI